MFSRRNLLGKLTAVLGMSAVPGVVLANVKSKDAEPSVDCKTIFRHHERVIYRIDVTGIPEYQVKSYLYLVKHEVARRRLDGNYSNYVERLPWMQTA